MSLYNKAKGTHEDRVDNSRSKKRRFSGNQFVENDGTSLNVKKSELEATPFEEIPKNTNLAYRIIDLSTLFVALQEMLICGTCKSKVIFKETPLRGLGFKIIVNCRCGDKKINSGPMIGNGYEINRRLILVMRLLAVSNEGINLFCNLMDIGKGFAKGTYDSINEKLSKSCAKVFDLCCKKAVEEAVAENEKLGIKPARDLPVSGDGTWKKRGHMSLFGVVTLVIEKIRKVVAIKVKSTFCQECKNNKLGKTTPEYKTWWKNHESDCSKNHEGSAGAMEPAAAIELFKESVEKYNVRYPIYIGDGDASTHKNIVDAKPYGDELTVAKRECVGQNANESLNALIWKFAPKHLHSGFETVEIASNLAGCIFNEGYLGILWIMQHLGIEIGERSFEYAMYVNKRRDKKKEKRRSESTHDARKARKEALLEEEDGEESPDDMLYGPGIAD